MGKTKKYIYPFIFSLIHFFYVCILELIIKTSFQSGDWGILGIIVFAIGVWLVIIIPIYCIVYSKTIIQEKHKFLFTLYNALVLAVLHILPGVTAVLNYIYCIVIFVVVEFETLIILGILIRLNKNKV